MEPLDFIAVSRHVLQLASRGMGRIEFLREASRLLLDFSGCDAVALIVGYEGGASHYRWTTLRAAPESFTFEPHYQGPAATMPCGDGRTRSGSVQISPWLEDLMDSVMGRRAGPKSRHVTAHGSFWCGDLAAELTIERSQTALLWAECTPIQSIAVVPFDIAPAVPGVLALLSERKHVFSALAVEFYESLAQTLGLAMDDRRAQHALRERVKELACLYAIAQVLESAEGPLRETLTAVVRLLPSAWQFPEALMARIRVDDTEVTAGPADRAVHRQEAAVVVNGVSRGVVEVQYVQDRPEFVEGAFLNEETHLIAAVAREVALHVQRQEVQQDKARLAEQIRQADRLATIGQLAAGVAHEINEPLGGILGFAQLAARSPDVPAPVVCDLDKIVRAALHAREIVRKLMLFARQSPLAPTTLRINAVVEESLGLLESRIAECGIRVHRHLDNTDPSVFADAVQLHQVVVNLCVNAMQAMSAGGTLTIRTRRSADGCVIEVHDTGAGIGPEIADHIFDPFFTTKSPEQGTGLGLSVVHGIVTAHRGTIRFDSRKGGGTRFEICLPHSASPTVDEARGHQ